ncbi:hypothetical protein ECE50_012750 [Chitinophaga sp. Mgbs1]|uniref:Uncharacterized protein n=1 Tax=Chitinophaga solisilvae TaxID=1233460 RepID=A0A3S1D433_9BACT|nr:hypothetical protein [Chitinophaga solisilvae]
MKQEALKKDILSVLEGDNPEDDRWLRFSRKIDEGIDAGWGRREVFAVLRDIFEHHAAGLSEQVQEELKEFENTITGFCDPVDIYRFPGDPQEVEALSAKVRSNNWR